MKTLLSTLLLCITFAVSAQHNYKAMMHDNSYNFYEVVEAAETHFKTHSNGKGSGWMGYQRWKNANEYKYFPTGDRTQTDPHFAEKALSEFNDLNAQTKSFFDLGWVDLGPYFIDSITGHYSAGLGRVEHFYINPNNTDLMYLGSRSGGFWRTSDGGANWLNTTDFMVATGVDAIAVSPTNPDSILINIKNARNGTTHGIYRSTDGGLTWFQTNFNPGTLAWGGLGTNDRIYELAYHPTIPNLIFVGTSRGIFKSSDNLQTWTQELSNSDITDLDFHPTNPSIIYLYDDYYWGANQNVVMRSTDLGVTYTASNQITGNNDARGHISVSTDCANCVYFGSSNGLWKSLDNGLNFSAITTTLSVGCDAYTVNDIDTSKMTYGGIDAYGSNDGGQSFSQTTFWSQGTNANFNNGQYVHADLRDAQSINGVYYLATDGFLCKSSDNGLTWDILSQGTGIRENYSLGVSQSNHYRSISGSQDNGTSIKRADHWLEFYGADGMEGIIHPLNDDWMMGSIQNGARRRTKDGGITQDGVTPSGQSGSWIAPLIYDPNDHMTVFSFGENIFKSSNFGDGWTNVGTPSFSGTISEAAIAQNNSDIIIVSRGSSIEKSIDGGATFTDIQSNLPNYTITDIAFSPLDDNIIVVTYARHQSDNQKIFISYNQGGAWSNITYNLQNMPIRKVVIDHYSNLYVGAEIGVFTKPLSSLVWNTYNPDLPNMAIEDLEVMWGSNTIRAATWGRGLWEYSLVGRSDYPAIVKTSITNTPSEDQPVQNVPQHVTSLFSYDHTITSAYVKYSVNNLNFNTVLPMSNTVDSTWVTDTPIPGVPLNDKVYFKVYAIGINNDTTETYKFMYSAKPACISAGNMSWATAITLVDFGTINNVTGKTQPYTDYSATDSIEMPLGSSETISVNLNTDGNYNIFSKAWIDWNQNGDYTDPGEEYDLGSTQNSADGITSNSPVTINVPSTAILGNTIMRVSAKFGSAAAPCETGFDGEVEDYKVIILPPNLDYTTTNLVSCVGDYIIFDYTGNTLDSLSWTFTNGTNNLTSTNLNDNVIFSDTGTYDLTILGYINGQVYTLDSNSIFVINTSENVLLNSTICQGETYFFDGQNLSTAGTYIDTITTPGCDSIVTLNLTVSDVETGVTNQGLELTANLSGATYQWVDCNDNWSPIIGETNQTYTPALNGEYAVIITNQNCIDTSSCYSIIGLGLKNLNTANIQIFPNPVHDQFTIDLIQKYELIDVEIYNELGQIILHKTFNGQQLLIFNLKDESNGIYFINLKLNNQLKTIELIKQ